MIIILSQKIDTDSLYSGDKVFKVYHYPARYKTKYILEIHLSTIKGIDMINHKDIISEPVK